MVFFEDVRYALRQLIKAPGFALTAILTLALGIGANTAIFSIIHAVLMHPSGVDAPERVAIMYTKYVRMNLDFPDVSVPDYADALSLKDQVETAALEQSTGFNIDHDGIVEDIGAARVTWQWFNVFGARPILGRTFTPEEDHPGANQIVVLSYDIWQRIFGGDPNIVGKDIILAQKPYKVIGVMRSDFDWPRSEKIWTPMGLPPDAYNLGNRFNESYYAAVRLRHGVKLEEFSAGLAAKSREEYARGTAGGLASKSAWGMFATPLTEYAAGPLRKPLYVLFGVVGLVLLIASANVAGLFLARASARNREFAIRTALGANAWRLVRQMLTETLLLAGIATILGIALGPAFGRALLLVVPQSLAEGYSVEMSTGVLAFTAGVGLLTALIAGVGPSVKIVRSQKKVDLHDGGRSATASVDKQRLRSAFVIGEVAMAFVLLAGTGLFLESLRQLQQVDPGFNPHGVLTGTVHFQGEGYKNNQERQESFVISVVSQLNGALGVKAVGVTTSLPFSDIKSGSNAFNIKGRVAGPNDPGPHSDLGFATADYLKAMQIPLLAGRWISAEDRVNTQPVVVIDQKLAKKYWPNESPVGQYVQFGRNEPWAEIVGVVADVRSDSLEEDTSDGMRYYPYSQSPNVFASFVVRTEGDPAQLINPLKRAISASDPTQTAFNITTLETSVNASLASRRLIVWLLTAFAGLALLLALIGIYGLISYVTVQRTNEIGIRMALGAQRRNVVGLIMKNALIWVGAGLVIGICLSVLADSMLKHAFAGFGGGVTLSLLISMAALLVVGVLAGLLPASRAASIDPAVTLRNE